MRVQSILNTFDINPSITKVNENYYFIARSILNKQMNYGSNETNLFVFDKDGVLRIKKKLNISNFAEDPRTILYKNNLYVFLNSWTKENNKVRMVCYKINYQGEVLGFKNINYGIQRQEKNWTPFVYNDEIYLSYNLNPHTVLKYDFDSNFCSLINQSGYVFKNWKHGIIRGGTNAIPFENQYLTFFHSTLLAPSRKYSLGACLFNPKENFQITKITKEPIIIKDFFKEPNLLTKHSVIFPSGLILEKDEFLISCGQNDSRSKIIFLKKEELLDRITDI